jgi:hypothetical protein
MAVTEVARPSWAVERVKGGLSSGEGLIHQVRDKIVKWDPKTESEIEVDPGVLDKRLLLIEPELAAVLAVMERGGNTISELLRRVWDGDRLGTLTRKEPLTATGAHISIIGHITLDELRARLTRTDMANGFANRFLFVLVKRSKELPFGGALDDSEIDRLGKKLTQIIESPVLFEQFAAPKRLEMNTAARAKWEHIYSELSAERPGLLGEVIARAEAHVRRLSLIYALLDAAGQIDVLHLDAALAVWEYCEASAVMIFGNALGDETADDIARSLDRMGTTGLTRTEINDLFGGHRKREKIGAALTLLLQHGRARMEVRQTRGRPTEMWFSTLGH